MPKIFDLSDRLNEINDMVLMHQRELVFDLALNWEPENAELIIKKMDENLRLLSEHVNLLGQLANQVRKSRLN